MSSRRVRSRQLSSRKITEDQIAEIVSKLSAILPQTHARGNERAALKVLKETCNYIRSLHREVDDLSERLSQMLATTEMSSSQAAMIRSLLMQ